MIFMKLLKPTDGDKCTVLAVGPWSVLFFMAGGDMPGMGIKTTMETMLTTIPTRIRSFLSSILLVTGPTYIGDHGMTRFWCKIHTRSQNIDNNVIFAISKALASKDL